MSARVKSTHVRASEGRKGRLNATPHGGGFLVAILLAIARFSRGIRERHVAANFNK
jgi:hypothetical protein